MAWVSTMLRVHAVRRSSEPGSACNWHQLGRCCRFAEATLAVLGRGSIGDLGERKAAAVCHRASSRSCGKTFDTLPRR